MPQLSNKVEWGVEMPLKPSELTGIRKTLKEANVPDDATLQIISWKNAEGYTVQATWNLDTALNNATP